MDFGRFVPAADTFFWWDSVAATLYTVMFATLTLTIFTANASFAPAFKCVTTASSLAAYNTDIVADVCAKQQIDPILPFLLSFGLLLLFAPFPQIMWTIVNRSRVRQLLDDLRRVVPAAPAATAAADQAPVEAETPATADGRTKAFWDETSVAGILRPRAGRSFPPLLTGRFERGLVQPAQRALSFGYFWQAVLTLSMSAVCAGLGMFIIQHLWRSREITCAATFSTSVAATPYDGCADDTPATCPRENGAAYAFEGTCIMTNTFAFQGVWLILELETVVLVVLALVRLRYAWAWAHFEDAHDIVRSRVVVDDREDYLVAAPLAAASEAAPRRDTLLSVVGNSSDLWFVLRVAYFSDRLLLLAVLDYAWRGVVDECLGELEHDGDGSGADGTKRAEDGNDDDQGSESDAAVAADDGFGSFYYLNLSLYRQVQRATLVRQPTITHVLMKMLRELRRHVGPHKRAAIAHPVPPGTSVHLPPSRRRVLLPYASVDELKHGLEQHFGAAADADVLVTVYTPHAAGAEPSPSAVAAAEARRLQAPLIVLVVINDEHAQALLFPGAAQAPAVAVPVDGGKIGSSSSVPLMRLADGFRGGAGRYVAPDVPAATAKVLGAAAVWRAEYVRRFAGEHSMFTFVILERRVV